jgi:hypothetical protein
MFPKKPMAFPITGIKLKKKKKNFWNHKIPLGRENFFEESISCDIVVFAFSNLLCLSS